jgi:hypothetical protein
VYLLALQSRPWTKFYVVCMFSGTGTFSFSSRYVTDLLAYHCNGYVDTFSGDGNCPNFRV